MENLIKRILLPIKLDGDFMRAIRPVAELAYSHGAELHLLYIGDPAVYRSSLWWFHPKVAPLELTKEKASSLQTIKEITSSKFTISVFASIEWGKWRSVLLSHAESIKADLIVLNEAAIPRKKITSLKSNLEYIIEKSQCQVITLLTPQTQKVGWNLVVIPITDFIPEIRLQTILETAILQQMKVHLITITPEETGQSSADFFYLTETLKRLKPAANLQVECHCLKNSYNPIDSFLHYARSVGADLLMTRMSNTRLQ
ncbi:MAG TPA: universal stress protein [Sediminibacterium sp.]|jgi:nucleotide-binding universal stress UspA family protein|nr:universal stress protein [Sediminibacterium sp.]HQS55983.1 universal stress protein [Sediminibacterium sp.]